LGELEAIKEIAELRGADSLLHLRCGENRLTARLDSAAARELGQNCRITMMPDKLYLFDAISGEAI
jgi:ABC-type sugar transport system ATPase subunit